MVEILDYLINKNILEVPLEFEHMARISNVLNIKEYLLRHHKVLSRPNFQFKGNEYITAKIIFNTLKTIVNFHTSYLVGNPVSITGDKQIVSDVNRLYKKGGYHKTDYEIVQDLTKYGNAFEYVYMDKNGTVKSKIIANEDSYPIYNDREQYVAFLEHWEDLQNATKWDIVYYPGIVQVYKDEQLQEEYPNLSGLPIHYSALDKSEYNFFGDAPLLDLIPILDQIERLLSRLDDAIYTLSMNPIGVSMGQKIEGTVPKDLIGATLNLEDGGDFKYSNAELDEPSIKLLLDTLFQQLYTVAAVPSAVIGQSNIANVSEVSLKLLFAQADYKASQSAQTLKEGFAKRFEYFRKLSANKWNDNLFDTLDVSFNLARPVDTSSQMNELKTQFDMGAISRETIIDNSPYTKNTALELQRIQAEESAKTETKPVIVGADLEQEQEEKEEEN